MTYTIEKITTLIGARRYGHADASISWLLTDSRSLSFPEQTLFFALRTQRGDGHRYIAELYRHGVRNFVVETLPDSYQQLLPDANLLRVTSALAALQRLAERHRDEFACPVVGITGSNGKTWVKEWLYQLLAGDGEVTRSPRSYNSQIGVPLSVWLLSERTRVALFEAGISQVGEMQALHDIIQPTVGVLTSLGAAHQENFRSMDEKCTEKLQLFRHAQAVVYPSDDDVVSRCLRRTPMAGELIGWSRKDTRAPMWVKVEGSHITYNYKGTKGAYDLPYIDEASVENSITCATVALHLGLAPDVLARRMALLEPIAMRLEVKAGQRGLTLINDSYNNDLQSLDIALDFMQRRQQQGADAASRTLVLSDIAQSGLSPAQLYAQVAAIVGQRGVTRLIGIGPDISAQAAAFSVAQKHFFATTDELLQSPLPGQLHDEVVLLKGARAYRFERIAEALEQKVHETILEVDLGALVHNLNHYRSLMRPGTKLVCMIKADAYGAGAVQIAKTLQDHRVDFLAVAVADEGVELRKAGITQDIIVMNPEMSSFKALFDYRLEPEVYSFRLLDALVRAARAHGITGWPVHIKLDTGMHRLGFHPEADIDTLVSALRSQTALVPRSVFSHFVGSDSDAFDSFSEAQFCQFITASDKLQAAYSHKILRHMDNTAGIARFPDRQLDMCRLGIGLYGVDPTAAPTVPEGATADGSGPQPAPSPLACVSTLLTTILQIRHVPASDTVGYSRRGILSRDSRIAAIPIGYADGLDRHLGNGRAYCLVNGRQARYVGNICMDVAMIDVTDIDCSEGDTVQIFGPDLPVTVLSEALDTIPYEVLTSVSSRVKRVYFQD